MAYPKAIMRYLFFFMWIPGYSQNLIINPGFEKRDTSIIISHARDSLAKCGITGWSTPTAGTPDCYFERACFYNYGSREAAIEKLAPYSGKAFAGLSTYYDLPGDPREFIEGELIQPLEAGKIYKFSVFIAIADFPVSNFRNDSLAIYFSPAKIIAKGTSIIPGKAPQLSIATKNVCIVNDQWEEISGYYKAVGGEKFFVFGNFNPRLNRKAETDSIAKRPQLPAGQVYGGNKGLNTPHSYYFMDNFMLTMSSEKEMKSAALITSGQKIIKNNIQFSTGDSTLNPASFSSLDEIIFKLKKQPTLNVEICGHTDNIGTPDKNQKLSEARARAVAQYFKAHGIAEERIKTTGYGSSKPVGTDPQKNRRVEFLFYN